MVAAALAAGLALASSACDSGTGGISKGGDVARGEALFKEKCGGCHTLAAAGTAGVIGPNLDDAFASDRAQGFDESSIQQVVAGQIREPSLTGRVDENGQPITSTGSPAMPADIVTGDDVDAVAAYVASVAGKPGAAKPPSGGQATSGKDIFTANCGGCHTLADAGTSGHRRAKPRPGEAAEVARRDAGDERQVPDAAVQGRAHGRADPGRRRLRLLGRR